MNSASVWHLRQAGIFSMIDGQGRPFRLLIRCVINYHVHRLAWGTESGNQCPLPASST